MKSLRYRITRRPLTLEDCLDKAAAGAPGSVVARLEPYTMVGNVNIIQQWLLVLDWSFPDEDAHCQVVCGATMLWNPPATRRARMHKVEQCIRETLHRIESAGATVQWQGASAMEVAV